jgi:hypothetical protein
MFVFDLSGYDPDIYPPGVVEHQPPLIARSDETVTLAFWLFDTIYCEELQRYCWIDPSCITPMERRSPFNVCL